MLPSFDIMATLAFETLRISVPTILDAASGNVSTEVCTKRLDSWSQRLLKGAEIRLAVRGREWIVPGEGYIVMSNHQSHYDIPVLFQALQIPMRMVAKKELFQIPFMAGAMRAAGFVELDRQNHRNAFETLITAPRRLTRSVSVWIAPEGTRSRTGRLGSFKRGGFRMAIHAGMPILPVTIEGTRHILPAGQLRVNRGHIARVTIGAPVSTAHYSLKTMDALIATVRRAISHSLSEATQPEFEAEACAS